MSDETPHDVVAEARALLDGSSPAPWHWSGFKSRGGLMGPYLACWVPGQGRTVVMDFHRLGMYQAQPRFRIDDLMVDGVDLAVQEVPHRKDIAFIDHPDAKLIVEAPRLLQELVDEVERLRAEVERLHLAEGS